MIHKQSPDAPECRCLSSWSLYESIDFKTSQRIHEESPDSPEPRCLSARSIYEPIDFKTSQRIHEESPDSPEPRCLSARSLYEPIDFKTSQRIHEESPDSPEPRCLSSWSLYEPIDFKTSQRIHEESPDSPEPRCLSARSIYEPIDFKTSQRIHEESPDSPEPRCLSARSIYEPIDFKTSKSQRIHLQSSDSPEPGCLSVKGDQIQHGSADQIPHEEDSEVLRNQATQKNQTDLDSIFMMLEDSIMTFVKAELKRFRRVLTSDYPEYLQSEGDELVDRDEEQRRKTSREAFLRITLDFLKTSKQEDLADCLQSRTSAALYQIKLKSNIKKKYQCVFEGISTVRNPTLLNQIYTELFITEGGTAEVNDEHEVRQIETASRKPHTPERAIRYEDIFKSSPGRVEPIRTVMTKGVAGIGKTVLTHKFTLDWAEDKANQDIQLMFPFTFRELNVLTKKYSLMELVHDFFTETKEVGICKFEEFQVVFIFDGLDECRLPLDFRNNEILTDVTKSTSVDVLLTNLIRGKLLPSARVWITTRPAAANQIPAECIDMVTEVRGFNDPQKEEYFRKRFRNNEQASRIISHIKTSRSLHIMCHIPVFCWITATVLEDVLKTRKELPSTLTDIHIHFLVVQSKLRTIKYDGGSQTEPLWNPDSKKMIESLGKLAYEQLQKGNLIFYESDLSECGIDIRAASVYSGVFTQIFKEERGLYQDKVFCFVHLSVQEFLAALHVHLTFRNSGVNLLLEENTQTKRPVLLRNTARATQLYQSAVDKALKSPNGNLDLFLRFLLGLSVQANQTLLRGLLTEAKHRSETTEKTANYIKKIIRKNLSPDRSINLFHCLRELNDQSLKEEIHHYLNSGSLSPDKLSPAQWSALGYILVSSEKDLDEFDLKKHLLSEEALLRLLPLVKASNKALLSEGYLSQRSCSALASVISSSFSSLKELDLSNNDLQDAGLKLLSAGLASPHCTLETLRVSGCMITEEGCVSLASALRLNPSHLRDLDLSYNHPGDSGVKLLSSGLQDPDWRLETLRTDHRGQQWLKPGLRKYACELELDPNTANRNLKLSNNNRKVTTVQKEQPYPHNSQRFTSFQLLCRNNLTERCYWEVEWRGWVHVGVAYRENSAACQLGRSHQSWSLKCSDGGYSVWHDNKETALSLRPTSNRVAVYVDSPAGTLSFYRVSSDTLIHLHTFNTTFSEPLYAGFRFCSFDSMCQVSPSELKERDPFRPNVEVYTKWTLPKQRAQTSK